VSLESEKPPRGRFLHSVRDVYPPFRVDLTVLFSKEIIRHGWSIDWHMRNEAKSGPYTHVVSPQERVFLSRGGGKEKNGSIINNINFVAHDIRLVFLILKGNYTFVQVMDDTLAAVLGLFSARIKGLPFIYWMSFPFCMVDVDKATDKDLEISSFHRLAYFLRGKLCSAVLYRLVLPRANHIFVQSEQMKRDLAAIGIAEEKMTAVPMGIDLEMLTISGNKQDVIDPRVHGKRMLLYLGTMPRARRIEFLVDVLALVVDRFENVILVLVGDAPPSDMAYLRRYVELSGMKDRVVFTGFIPRERAWDYVRRADVCLSPFRPIPILNSTSPTKIVEYMALGRPVVANNTPDQDSLLRESGAGYSVPYTERDFAEAVIGLLEDPVRAEEMGKRGQAYIQKTRSYRVIGDKVNEVYESLIRK